MGSDSDPRPTALREAGYESNQPKERYQASQLIESLIPSDMHEARELEPQPALAGLSQSVS